MKVQVLSAAPDFMNLSETDKAAVIVNALIHGDFVLASGERASVKLDFDRVEGELYELCVRAMAEILRTRYPHLKTLVSVAHGATRIAESLKEELDITHIATDHDGEKPRVFRLLGGVCDKVVIVEDIFNKGTNTGKVAQLVTNEGGDVQGIVAAINRSANSKPFIQAGSGILVPVAAAIHYDMESGESKIPECDNL